jgi:hypothetical protein
VMKHEEDLKKIDLYLRNKLTADEKSTFEKILLLDGALLKEISIRKAEFEVYERLVEVDLRQKMLLMDKEIPTLTVSKNLNYWFIRAAGLLLLLSTYWFFNKEKESQIVPILPTNDTLQTPKIDKLVVPNEDQVILEPNQKIKKDIEKTIKNQQNKSVPNNFENKKRFEDSQIAALSTPANFEHLVRGDNNFYESLSDTLKRAIEAFKRQDFETALQLSSTISSKDKAEKHWLSGHIYFQQKKFTAASNEFKTLSEMKTDVFRDRDEWMWLLSMVSEYNKTNDTILFLIRKIEEDEGHPFNLEVKKLKELLK